MPTALLYALLEKFSQMLWFEVAGVVLVAGVLVWRWCARPRTWTWLEITLAGLGIALVIGPPLSFFV